MPPWMKKDSYPGAGPPLLRLKTWRGFSKYWNLRRTLKQTNKIHSLNTGLKNISVAAIHIRYRPFDL